MKNAFNLFLLLILSFPMHAQEWQTPAIEGYGKIKYFENAAVLPDTSLSYKILFDLKEDTEKDGVNAGLWKIARTLNLLKAGKIPNENINIVAVLHGDATYVVLSNEKYQEQSERPNPNIELLRILKEKGVTIYVCGQATASRGIEEEDINKDIEIALSALTVLPYYQLKGYALIP